jgi:hypothetical protein
MNYIQGTTSSDEFKIHCIGRKIVTNGTAEEFGCKPSTILEAFKIMIKRTKLIQITKPPPDADRHLSKV